MIIKKLYNYFIRKSVKQRICICIVVPIMLMLLFFTVKENFFPQDSPQTSVSESAESTEGETANASPTEYSPPDFRISIIDSAILIAVITAYTLHKFREKRKQRRL